MFLTNKQLEMEYLYVSSIKVSQLIDNNTLYQKLLCLKFAHDNGVIDFNFYSDSYKEVCEAFPGTKQMPEACSEVLRLARKSIVTPADDNFKIIGYIAFIEYFNYLEEYERCAEYKKIVIDKYLTEEQYFKLYDYVTTEYKMDWSILDK